MRIAVKLARLLSTIMNRRRAGPFNRMMPAIPGRHYSKSSSAERLDRLRLLQYKGRDCGPGRRE
jgi:hypothetical protein